MKTAKDRNYTKQKILLWFFIIAYSAFGLYNFFAYGSQLYEYFFISVFFLVIFFRIKRFKLSSSIIILMALVPFLHTVAMIPFFVNGEEFTIYNSQFNYQFDFITHVAGFVIASLIALQIIYNKNKKVKVWVLTAVFFALIGLGACFEQCEFYGYYVFGFGKGTFHFGEGDNSANFGPWGDSMTDITANIIGIMIGYLLHFGSLRIRRAISEKNS